MGAEAARRAVRRRGVRPQVHAVHRRAEGQRQPRRRLPGPRHPHDQDALAGEAVLVAQAHQRTFSVDRATSASRMLMIQNRTMILGSDHPSFS